MMTSNSPTNPKDSNLKDDINAIDELIDTLHDAEKSRTLEEQVAYLKSQGIDPAKSYKQWDDDKDEKDDW